MNSSSPSNRSSLRLSYSPQSEDFWQQLPSSPGVYIFEDKEGKPLYIGKSINIRSRIKQHFEGSQTGTTKAHLFSPLTSKLYIKTVVSDIEAIILEANYIKSYLPRYNDVIKDNSSNLYIVFTGQPSPRIIKIRATDIRTLPLDDYQKQVFGPYASSNTANNLLKQIRRIFGYCQSPFNSRGRACFYRHLNRCPGACDGGMTIAEYNIHLGRIKKFLSGQFKILKKQLEKDINRASKKQDYETAGDLRNELVSLNNTLSTQSTSLLLSLSDANDQLIKLIPKSIPHPFLVKPPSRIECFDLAHLQGESYTGSMAVFVNCAPANSEYRHFAVRQPDRSDPYAMKQIISRRFNHPEWSFPDLLVLDGGIPQLSIVSPSVPSNIPVIALAKKRETIYFQSDGKIVSINLNLDDPVLNLLRHLRDEAHRIANTYHARLRSKRVVDEA